MSKPGFENVIVVGAGPSGLLMSLLLAKKGIPVHLIDAAETLDSQPRAAHYGPPAIPDLRRAGIMDRVRERGMTLNTMCWRKLDTEYIAGLDGSVLADIDPDPRTACLALQDLDKIMLDDFESFSHSKVSWRHKVMSIGQDEQKAWINVETPTGEIKMEASYIIGCDGANSQIRRSLFGDKNFPGFTWDQQIVATNTYYDFRKFGYHDANFIIHPEHLYMAAIIQEDGLWRVTYGEKPGLSLEELKARQEWKFETILPGNPKPGDYKVMNFSPYRMHQRLAEKFRVGRFLLAADAAHLCNPFGGLGITGGFVDVGGLYDCLVGLWEHKADDSILDLYSDIRRQKYKEFIDPISTENFKRLWGQDADTALENDGFLQLCKKAETDKEFAKQLQLGMMAVRYDFTQHYKDAKPNGETDGAAKMGVDVSHIEIAPTAAN